MTSAHYADSYVWSSRPVAGDGASTIWLVPRESNGLSIVGKFTGLGLRGNDSTPVVAESVRIPASSRLGEDGGGFGVMMVAVLPIFNLLNASCSIGVMEGALARTIEHANKTKFEHTGQSIAEQPTARQHLARARIKADMARTLVFDTADSLVAARPDAMLRVLECKACAADTATEVLGLLMRVAGGAAYRADVGVERYFRDAQAATVMAPTTDALHDFIGKAICGLDLF
ncbi:MAG: acyl-CoA dehydrogenase family protein [Candidatus Eisenbacteria bacterium]